ncbi:MAG: TIGR01212 family radical SAM protein [Deltaproteobacteria bacterium]|nr:TIGR01212 family radical SAM protein [Deltaproteobacteria bacterium]
MERYNSIGNYLKQKFGAKVFKVSLNGNFSCPNRDGIKGTGGCIYCNPESNRPFISQGNTIKEQLLEGIEYAKKRHQAAKFISYFQHYSNTYADPKELKSLYNDAISDPDVAGLAISTRPDCLTADILDLLSEINQKTFLWLELGLQTANDATLRTLNRHHSVKDFENAAILAVKNGIKICAHIILGLPGETRSDLLNTIELLNNLKIWGVKIHNLHVLKETELAKMYARGEIRILELQEYASMVVDCLELLDPKILIHRFNSHSPKDLTIAPEWSVNKLAILNSVHNELLKRGTWQGRLFSTPEK